MLGTLAEDRARVAELDDEILVLERALSALRVQRAQAQDRLDAYKYPVLTLPNEIIAKIFVRFVPDYPHCPPLTGLESPTLLTQICRKWRAIALGTPTLWSAIMLPDSNIPPTEQASVADVWLSRSRGCPVSFHFGMQLGEGECDTEILSTIAPYRSRLEHFVAHLAWTPQFQAVESPTPLLRHLELLFDNRGDSPTQVSILEAPLLRTVLLGNIGVDSVILPWAQLTSLALYEVFLQYCAPILQQTPNLEHCELILMGDLHDEDVVGVTLPSLQSLALINTFEHQRVTGYLQTLITPALRSLRVQELFLGPNFVDTLKSFLSKSGCTLRELCITGSKSGSNASYHTAFPSTEVSFDNWNTYLSSRWLIFQ